MASPIRLLWPTISNPSRKAEDTSRHEPTQEIELQRIGFRMPVTKHTERMMQPNKLIRGREDEGDRGVQKRDMLYYEYNEQLILA